LDSLFAKNQVHREQISSIPNAIQGRTSIEVDIYGMEGIPHADMQAHQLKLANKEGPKNKKRKQDDSDSDEVEELSIPNFMAGQLMPGMMPGFNPMMGGQNMVRGPNPNMQWPGMMNNGGFRGPMPGPMGMGGPMMRPQGGPPMAMVQNPMGMHPRPRGFMPPQERPMVMPQRPSNPTTDPTVLHGNNEVKLEPKPLFPAASNIQVKEEKTEENTKTFTTGPKMLSATSELMHPGDEHLSLEEIRMSSKKYKTSIKKFQNIEKPPSPMRPSSNQFEDQLQPPPFFEESERKVGSHPDQNQPLPPPNFMPRTPPYQPRQDEPFRPNSGQPRSPQYKQSHFGNFGDRERGMMQAPVRGQSGPRPMGNMHRPQHNFAGHNSRPPQWDPRQRGPPAGMNQGYRPRPPMY